MTETTLGRSIWQASCRATGGYRSRDGDYGCMIAPDRSTGREILGRWPVRGVLGSRIVPDRADSGYAGMKTRRRGGLPVHASRRLVSVRCPGPAARVGLRPCGPLSAVQGRADGRRGTGAPILTSALADPQAQARSARSARRPSSRPRPRSSARPATRCTIATAGPTSAAVRLMAAKMRPRRTRPRRPRRRSRPGAKPRMPGLRRDDQVDRAACRYCGTEFDTVDPLSLKDLHKQVKRKSGCRSTRTWWSSLFILPSSAALPRSSRSSRRSTCLRKRKTIAKAGPIYLVMGYSAMGISYLYSILVVLFWLFSAVIGDRRSASEAEERSILDAAVARSLIACPREVGVECPHCAIEIALGDPIMVCQACGTVHHRACWGARGGCGSYSCAGAAAGAPGEPTEPVLTITRPRSTAHPVAVAGLPHRSAPGWLRSAPTGDDRRPGRREGRPRPGPGQDQPAGHRLVDLRSAGDSPVRADHRTGRRVLGALPWPRSAAAPAAGGLAMPGLLLGIVDVTGWVISPGWCSWRPHGPTRFFADLPPDMSVIKELEPALQRAMRANVLIERPGWRSWAARRSARE